MNKRRPFFSELQRRHVVRAALAHLVVFWLIVQVADVALPYIGVTDQPVRWAFVAGVALFPVTLIIAWFVEHPWHHYTSSRVFVDVAVIAVIAITAGVWVMKNIPQVIHTRTSIVVLPFEYPPEDPLGQGLSRAVALEVNSLLMKSGSIDVVGYESASSTLLKGLDVPGIVDMLGVQHVLSGVISSAEASVKVSVHLHDYNGAEVWSSDLSDSVENLYAVQERIAVEVQERLGESGAGVAIEEIATQRCPMPVDPEALERYYTARHYVESRTDSEASRAQLREAVAIYERLIEQYPNFAQAYSALAWARHNQSYYDPASLEGTDSEAVKRELAERAVELCDTLGEALVFLPNESDHPNPWVNSVQNMELWIELQPESLEAREKLLWNLQASGQRIRGLRLAEETYRMNPLSVRAIKMLSRTYMGERRWDEAIALEEKSFELGSTAPPFATISARMFACKEDLDCLMDTIPPPIDRMTQQLREIYSNPDNADQARQKIELALALLDESPMLLNWLKGSTCRFEHLTPLFARLWDRAVEMEMAHQWFWQNTWNPECGKVWESAEFSRIVEEGKWVEFWKAKGWPDACEPQGDEFACSRAIWRRNRIEAGVALPETAS